MAVMFSSCSFADADVSAPLQHIERRVSVLTFGMHVTPDPNDNPIDPPERFAGYHAATDFEVGVDELDADVPVSAICAGETVYGGFADGYGGLVVQRCILKGQDVTVIYGHLTVDGLPKAGTQLEPGQQFAVLAPARSHDSDGNRKHLHLGIHIGKNIDERGYVQTEEELSEFIDPMSLIPESMAQKLFPEIEPYWKAATGSLSS